jgi:hypothetical protein
VGRDVPRGRSGRASLVDFSTPYAQSDFTYLVAADSALRASADADPAG